MSPPPDFSSRQTACLDPGFKIQYAVGVDGISLLLVLLTTLMMPLCVLASWRYIQTRVQRIHDLPADHGDGHGRRLLRPGPGSLLLFLGSDAHPDGAADRDLGRAAQDLRLAEVLHLHHVRAPCSCWWRSSPSI